MAQRWDVVVVGAGPGGSTAAYDLAQAGARVLLLDRARFPRDKPCGGGVLVSALKMLPFSLDPVTERTITAFRVRYKRSWQFEHRYHEPLAVMTQRSRLDAFLCEQAQSVGAEFRDASPVRAIDGTTVTLANGDVHAAEAIIAADGANGVVRRSLWPAAYARRRRAGGQRVASGPGGLGAVDGRRGTRARLAARRLRLGLPQGQPLQRRVGRDAGRTGPMLRDELAQYAGCESLSADELTGLRGHHLPLRDPDSALSCGRTAFIGDAAGLIDPLAGEGIGNAFRSGQLAAAAALDIAAGRSADFSAYRSAVEAEIEPDLRVARQLHALFHITPWPYVQMLRRSERYARAFCRIVRGESSYSQMQARLGPAKVFVEAAAALADRRLRRSARWQVD